MDYAKAELEREGLLDTSADYNGEVGKAVLELIRVFETQGHSGGSAAITLQLFNKLARFQPLSPVTNDPEEWTEVTDNLWQSRRNANMFSHDGGKTGYSLDDPKRTVYPFPSRTV